jgi:hypothetical protein
MYHFLDPPVMGRVSPDRIVDPAILELRDKKKTRLRELRGVERLNSIVRARQYRAVVDQAQHAILAHQAREEEEQRSAELRQVLIMSTVDFHLQGWGDLPCIPPHEP